MNGVSAPAAPAPYWGAHLGPQSQAPLPLPSAAPDLFFPLSVLAASWLSHLPHSEPRDSVPLTSMAEPGELLGQAPRPSWQSRVLSGAIREGRELVVDGVEPGNLEGLVHGSDLASQRPWNFVLGVQHSLPNRSRAFGAGQRRAWLHLLFRAGR